MLVNNQHAVKTTHVPHRVDPEWMAAMRVMPAPTLPQGLLLASRVATMLGEAAVPQALEALVVQFPDTGGPRAPPGAPPAPPPFRAMHLARSLHRDAQV